MVIDTATKEERMRANKGMLIASAAASLIMAGALTARAGQGKTGGDKVDCAGVNARQGEGSCAPPENSRAGKNGCQGTGVVQLSGGDGAQKGRQVAEKPQQSTES